MKTAAPNVLMVYVRSSSFVERDIRLLQPAYAVQRFVFTSSPKWKTPLSFLRLFFHLLFLGGRYEWVMCQAGGYHSMVAGWACRLRGVPMAVVAIGTDAASFPQYGYGNFSRKLLGWATRRGYALARVILPVSARIEGYAYSYEPGLLPRQGIRAFCPGLRTPVIGVDNGYDTAFWEMGPPEKRRPRSLLTVSLSLEGSTFYVKGIDLILETARLLPEYEFTLLGNRSSPWDLPPNVKHLPATDAAGLRDLYQSHTYYLQVSLTEGFPNALAEAMLCGAVPIGSDVSSIPGIIADTGYILRQKDAAALAALIRRADASGTESLSRAASARIRTVYTQERRQAELLEILKQYR